MKIKTIGRKVRRARARYTDMIRAMDPEGVYTLTNKAGQRHTQTGKAWKEALANL